MARDDAHSNHNINQGGSIMDDKKNNCVEIDVSKIPESTRMELAKVAYRAARNFFSNITTEQQADYEQWLKEYRSRQKETAHAENSD